MNTSPSTRRDTRFVLRPGSGRVEFDHPRLAGCRCSSQLTMVSVAGLDFGLDESIGDVSPGMVFAGATVRVGDCALRGDVAIRNVAPGPDGLTRLGCLFYPASREDEGKLMALIAGMEAVQSEA